MRGGIRGAYATSLLGVLSGLLTNLWFLRELTRFVGREEFGVYAYVLQCASYLAFAQLGLDFAASRQIAVSLGNGDEQEAGRTYRALCWFNIRAASIAAVIACCLVVWLRARNPAPDLGSLMVPIVAALASCTQMITFLERPLSSALIGSKNQARVNILVVSRTISTTLLAYGLLQRGWGIYSIGVAEVVTHLGMWFLLRREAKRLCGWIGNVGLGFRVGRYFRELADYGVAASLGGVAWTIEATADVIILGWLRGPSEVASYVLWWRFPMLFFSLCTRLTESAFPYFAETHGKGIGALRRISDKVGAVSAGLGTLAMVGVGLWLPSFVLAWLGDAFLLPNPKMVALGMGLLVMSRVGGNFVSMLTLSRGDAAVSAWVSWIQAVLKIVLAVALGQRYGLLGVLLASVLASSVQSVLLGLRLFRLGILSTRLVSRATILSVSAVGIVGYLGAGNTDRIGVGGLVLGIAGTSAIWGILCFVVVFGLLGRGGLSEAVKRVYRWKLS